MSHTTATPIVAFSAAPEPGALDGHSATCSACGYVHTTSLSARQAEMLGWEHVRYMQRKEAEAA